MDCMFVCIFTVFALFLLVLDLLGMHMPAAPGSRIYAYLQCLRSFCLTWTWLECIVGCMFECIFTVFALFLLVLEELGMHSGLHVCIHIYGVCALFACPGRAWDA